MQPTAREPGLLPLDADGKRSAAALSLPDAAAVQRLDAYLQHGARLPAPLPLACPPASRQPLGPPAPQAANTCSSTLTRTSTTCPPQRAAPGGEGTAGRRACPPDRRPRTGSAIRRCSPPPDPLCRARPVVCCPWQGRRAGHPVCATVPSLFPLTHAPCARGGASRIGTFVFRVARAAVPRASFEFGQPHESRHTISDMAYGNPVYGVINMRCYKSPIDGADTQVSTNRLHMALDGNSQHSNTFFSDTTARDKSSTTH